MHEDVIPTSGCSSPSAQPSQARFMKEAEMGLHLFLDDIHLDRVLDDPLAGCNLLLLDLHMWA